MDPARPYLPPDGPRWVPNAQPSRTHQTDGRGVEWIVTKVEQGGRVVHWFAGSGRVARTEITPTDPRYPSDDQVLQWQCEQKKAKRNPYAFW